MQKVEAQFEILTYDGIDSVLNTFKKVPYAALGHEYLKAFGYNVRPDEYKISYKSFYEVVGKDVFKNLVGNFTVNDFLPKDSYWKKNLDSINNNYTQYFFMEAAVLHRFLDLILLLKEHEYDYEALKINDGFRYPNFNNETGGAFYSQHLWGKAIDLAIGDINKDGIIDEKNDKKIILDFLENNVFLNSGGISRYPNSDVVHFDIRDKKARWNAQ